MCALFVSTSTASLDRDYKRHHHLGASVARKDHNIYSFLNLWWFGVQLHLSLNIMHRIMMKNSINLPLQYGSQILARKQEKYFNFSFPSGQNGFLLGTAPPYLLSSWKKGHRTCCRSLEYDLLICINFVELKDWINQKAMRVFWCCVNFEPGFVFKFVMPPAWL